MKIGALKYSVHDIFEVCGVGFRDTCERARCTARDFPFLGSSEIPLSSFLFLTNFGIPIVLGTI